MTPLFTWMDAAPLRYWIVAWSAFGACVLLAWRPWRGDAREGRTGALLFAAALGLGLVAFRWPGAYLSDELNHDESQFLAGAITLRHDPVYWRSVDGQTAGPLVHYALVPLTMLDPPSLYSSARWLGLALVAGVIVLNYFTARLVCPERIARVGTLSLLVFFALTAQPDFVHFSSEHVPIFLISAATACAMKGLVSGGWAWPLACGLLAGAIPLAKPQGAPQALMIFGCAAVFLARGGAAGGGRWRALGALLAGGLLVPLGLLAYAFTFDLWHEIRVSYFDANVSYVGETTLSQKLLRLRYVFSELELESAAPLFVSALVVGGAALLVPWRQPDRVWPLLALAITGLLGGTTALVLAGAGFMHYFLLLAPPLGLLATAGLARLHEARTPVGRGLRLLGWSGYLGVAVCLPVIVRGMVGSRLLDARRGYGAGADGGRDRVVERVKSLVPPGEPLAVWGWTPRVYVRTGCVMATREANTSYQVEDTPEREYFRERFMRDLARNDPAVFVDATAGFARGMRVTFARRWQMFPALVEHLKQHYEPPERVGYALIYVRRDRAGGGREAPGTEARGTPR